ncbi:hypothetical protein KFE25_014361 [Diacronema lutheri]|uniref:Uncharacterized protein n=2 Tax=Diacronema lutheri TaxID=2081491 RepID=A0A8J5X5D8_DIALT|nr:hypothetical protein KFE25_014361 [Diacronema lutheri]
MALWLRCARPRAAPLLRVRAPRRRLCDTNALDKASSKSWSAEWQAIGLGATRADASTGPLNRLLFVQLGFGCDQHGDRSKGSTKAAVRAVRNAIEFNSIPGAVFAIPGGRSNMLVHVKLGVPSEAPAVDVDEVAKVFPYGRLLPIEIVHGGLAFGCGRVVPELGDEDDTALVVVAAVSIGYHDLAEGNKPKAWDTRDGH